MSKMAMAILAIVFGTGLAGGAVGYLLYSDPVAEKIDPITMNPPSGPFTLADHTGRQVTDETYRGKLMLIAFGYTYCPDVCPTGLQAMSTSMDMLGEQADWVQPIFITIDPARDDADVMKDYVEAFHPRLVGLTGTAKQIAKAAKGYRVYYNKTVLPKDDGEDKSADAEEDYSMGHTTSIYLVGVDGRGLAVFNFGMATTSAEVMVDRMRHFINIQEALDRAKK
ncbi:MAG: SCO family protein [Alphaproteobacteria bacterium]|jgi:protein SCO1/2|nr:SCO family protein [Alphaproteobacteria bacterium]MDP6255515.1 SCO family protein [Alphaproteobacteria bacterium]MDP7056532.1 SCO family protein [Alphaproteobacteria bacterium]MDP7229497.1 SCO family protein [Alphaproteobacteria bacterium]MDP7458670.1 SCO family protein [Alphaproteobacteria bacterium]|tara:strand:+ start:21136 stop:21807 length:672 start_codon:yes stop_codon:yes gene_type:complete